MSRRAVFPFRARPLFAFVAALCAALLFVPDARAQQPGPVPPWPKRVLTTFTILQDMAQNVAGDRATVESLTKPGAGSHDYDPTPQDLVRARNADLILWNGLGLERWFERFFEGMREVPSAVLTEGIAPVSLVEGPYEGKPNPHAWISPANATVYVENIRRALVRLDPANADTYDRNAAAYTAELRRLDAPIAEKLARIPEGSRVLVTCEGAFSHLARGYGLDEVYLWAVNSDQTGTPQQIRRVIDGVRARKVPAVFCESTVNDRARWQVARETRSRFGGTLYVDSLTPPGGPAPSFVQLLRYNADTILRGFDVAQ